MSTETAVDLHAALAEWTRLADADTRNVAAQTECAQQLARWVEAHSVRRAPVAKEIAQAGADMVAAIYRMVEASEQGAVADDIDVMAKTCRRRAMDVFVAMESAMPLVPANTMVALDYWNRFSEDLMNLSMHTGRRPMKEALGWARLLATLLDETFAPRYHAHVHPKQ
jgi:hypothetical protein